MAKIKLMITITEEDLALARSIAMGRRLTTTGSSLGPDVRGNVAALISELIREEIDRVINERDDLAEEKIGGEDDG